MKKKFVFISIFTVLMMVYTTAFAAQNGKCGDNATWSFENGTLTIRGTGEMKNYSGRVYDQGNTVVISEEYPSWKDLEITSIKVEEGITSIGAKAFSGLDKAKSISLPKSLEKIMIHAFNGSGIEHIDIPDNVKYIAPDVISDRVITLNIGSGVEELDDSIGFTGCSLMTAITVDSNNRFFSAVDGVLFNKDRTKLICYPASKAGESYIVPNTVKVIGRNAFKYCENLKSIEIPEGVTTIESGAFTGSVRLENVQIPTTVTKIDSGCFDARNFLSRIKYTYKGSSERFNQIRLTELNYIGEREDGKWLYEERESRLPEIENCVEITFDTTIKVLLNGKNISFDVPPQIIDNRTMVPMRAIFEAFGAKVQWIERNKYSKEIKAEKDNISIELQIGKKFMRVINSNNVRSAILDVSPMIVDSRTLVPVRAILEAFDCDVKWDGINRQVVITAK